MAPNERMVRNMIKFNIPPVMPKTLELINQSIENEKTSGDGPFTKKCNDFFENKLNAPKVLLTTSCTDALELGAILIDIKEGDEVIMPSFTFVSTSNAFVLRGAKIVFVDIRKDTLNIDETLIESAITSRTKAIVPVHYAGISCDMDKIMELAKKYNLYVIEDAAQGVNSFYNGKPLGTIGDIGCFSFHETKNYVMGEGGAIIINNSDFIERAEIIREKGTNRSRFLRGQVDKYTWTDIGSSFLPSDILAAYLFSQLEEYDHIKSKRLASWESYNKELESLEILGKIRRPVIPNNCEQNAHMYYFLVKDIVERTKLINHLNQNGIMAIFHYVPLHSSPAGLKYGRFNGKDTYTTDLSSRLIRIPLYYGLMNEDIIYICKVIKDYFLSDII